MRVHSKTFTALLAFTAVVVVGARAHAGADSPDTYVCRFTEECIANTPCVAGKRLAATLTRDGDGDGENWVVITPKRQTIRFSVLGGTPVGTLRLVSVDMDAGANAAGMLSISETGQAILSVHGYFPGLDVVTHLGTCTPKDN